MYQAIVFSIDGAYAVLPKKYRTKAEFHADKANREKNPLFRLTALTTTAQRTIVDVDPNLPDWWINKRIQSIELYLERLHTNTRLWMTWRLDANQTLVDILGPKGRFLPQSPDGFTIEMDARAYADPEGARKALEKWAEGFKTQGYYSRSIPRHEKIDYAEIVENCSLTAV